jgi:hypothetical protein
MSRINSIGDDKKIEWAVNVVLTFMILNKTASWYHSPSLELRLAYMLSSKFLIRLFSPYSHSIFNDSGNRSWTIDLFSVVNIYIHYYNLILFIIYGGGAWVVFANFLFSRAHPQRRLDFWSYHIYFCLLQLFQFLYVYIAIWKKFVLCKLQTLNIKLGSECSFDVHDFKQDRLLKSLAFRNRSSCGWRTCCEANLSFGFLFPLCPLQSAEITSNSATEGKEEISI